MLLTENTHFELIPDSTDSTDSWFIRILEGDFVETIFQFQKITVVDDGLKFNFNLISTPDGDLTEENEDLQKHVGMILYAIIENSLKDEE